MEVHAGRGTQQAMRRRPLVERKGRKENGEWREERVEVGWWGGERGGGRGRKLRREGVREEAMGE